MHFFPHIESGSSSSSSFSAGFFTDRPTDDGFSSFLSSHMEEPGLNGGDLPADKLVSHAETQDSSDVNSFSSEPSLSGSEAEKSHDSPSFNSATVTESASMQDNSASENEMSRQENSAHGEDALPAKPAASDTQAKEVEHAGEKILSPMEEGAESGIMQGFADLARNLESLLESIQKGQAEGSKPQGQDKSISGALEQLQKLVDVVRTKVPNSKPDTEGSVRFGVDQVTERDLRALQKGLRSILLAAGEALDNGLQTGNDDKSTAKMTLDVLKAGADKSASLLSAQDRELLREALINLDNLRAQLFPKEKVEGQPNPVRPTIRREAIAKTDPQNKAEQTLPLRAKAQVTVQVGQNNQPSPVQVAAVTEEKKTGQADSPVTKGTVRGKTEQTLSPESEISTAARTGHAAMKAEISESTSEAGGKQEGGKFFQDNRATGGEHSQIKISDTPEKFDAVGLREPLGAERHQNAKVSELDGAFAAQPNASNPTKISGPAMKGRSTEVYRQVEAGAFRDLGQGNKQLVIRLDPPDLGQVSVVLQVRGKEVQAVLRTSNQEASQVLTEQLGQLRAQLESQGLRVSRLEVQTQLSDSQTDARWQGAEQHNRYQENRELAMTAQRLRSLGRVESSLAQDMQSSPHKENISLTGVDVFA